MRLTIFGATGGIGSQLLEQALAAGHEVTAVVRDPSRLSADVRAITPTWPRLIGSRSRRR